MADTTETEAEREVHLTPTERRILEFIAAHQGEP